MDTRPENSTNKILSELYAIQGRLTADEQVALANLILVARNEAAGEVEAHQFMPPSMSTYEYARRDHEQRLREARASHVADLAEAGKPSFFSKVSDRLGKLLVSTGYKLLSRPVSRVATETS